MAIQTTDQQEDLSFQDLYHYFVPPPPPVSRWRRWMAVGVVLMAIVLLSNLLIVRNMEVFFGETLCFGWPILVSLVMRSRERARLQPYQPTDSEYNAWVNHGRTWLLHQGLLKLGLTTSDIIGEILYIRGIIWPDSRDGRSYWDQGSPVKIKHGADGLLHASIYRFTFFYPTRHYLAIFSCDVNALHPVNYQTTQTYFYQDIVGIETHERRKNIDNYNYGTQRFEVHISNGEILSSVIYAPEAPVERIVLSLRTLLRDKKYGVNGGGRGYAGS